ncbi:MULTISPECIES: M4 family metallopeptidase [unclassified Microbacterium]|uniref:M4 family metallopeptidase n=1 Tax=unclassified Microbacterium TaxID=2609290 RepID=UPI00214CB002|nr:MULTISPECIES: M4 family metallopeptidase [unclassified Microbacterium]MCR2810177.1 M4 family metallopeptidase [Microbacterium sp. zg.B185]WIM19989.1 M4 family metallopeptidase [Microbacterium sp. zg-B185]
MTHAIVPPYLLARIAAVQEPAWARAAEAARSTLETPREYRPVRSRLRISIGEPGTLVVESGPAPDRTVSDAQNREQLPGVRVRGEDDPPSGDVAVDEAFDGLGATFDFFWDAYGRSSIDGAGSPLLATVHYGRDYDNAFWNGERMVFGDGDGEVFVGFTGSLTVIAHELTHGMTEHEVGLVYEGQSGALNESVSDVFGALAEQHSLGQTVEQGSWLIGAGIFTAAVQGVALRSLAAPGTAYDDDVLGRDPQPAHMDGYVQTSDDNGGVHINSGIPNHAFYLTARALGGRAWERAGLIWYRALTSGSLSSTADFTAFAAATLAAAEAEYGEDSEEVDAVRAGWTGVGVRNGRSGGIA